VKRLYHCEYCDRADVTRRAMREHEADCDGNPATRCCWTCNFHLSFPHDRFYRSRVWERCYVLGRVKYTRHCNHWERSNGKAKWVGSIGNDFSPRSEAGIAPRGGAPTSQARPPSPRTPNTETLSPLSLLPNSLTALTP
jgi:hypothetical protein